MRTVILSIVCAMITVVCGGALCDEWGIEDPEGLDGWIEPMTFAEACASQDVDEWSESDLEDVPMPGGEFDALGDDGICELVSITGGGAPYMIFCEWEEHSVDVVIGKWISLDRIVVCMKEHGDPDSSYARIGWADWDATVVALQLSDTSTNAAYVSIQNEELEYNANCDFDDFPSKFDGATTIDTVTDYVWGSEYADNITGHEVQGLGGDDTIQLASGAGTPTAWGGAGGDTITGTSATDYIFGDHSSVFAPDPGEDVISGLGGADYLYGFYLADEIYGGAGADHIYGGDGNDPALEGGTGDDYISGGAGNDTLRGEEDYDDLYGGSEDDTLYGGPPSTAGADYCDGQTGTDSCQPSCEDSIGCP